MKADEVRKRAFSMPLHSPAYPRGPYRFVNREYLIIAYRTDPAALKKVVPKPLEIMDAIVKYEFIRMPDSTGFGDYTESGQVIPVRQLRAFRDPSAVRASAAAAWRIPTERSTGATAHDRGNPRHERCIMGGGGEAGAPPRVSGLHPERRETDSEIQNLLDGGFCQGIENDRRCAGSRYPTPIPERCQQAPEPAGGKMIKRKMAILR